MIKIILIIWLRLKSIGSAYISLHDLVVFFNKVWSVREWILIGTVLLWIPLLRLSCLLYMQFGIRIPFGLPKKHAKLVLLTAYWLTVVATFCNLVAKYQHGMELMKLVSLVVANVVILIVDYREIEDTIRKVEEKDKI